MLGGHVRSIVSLGLEPLLVLFDKQRVPSHLFLQRVRMQLGSGQQVEREIDSARAMNRWYKNSLPEGRPFRIISGDQLPSCRGPYRHHGRDLS